MRLSSTVVTRKTQPRPRKSFPTSGSIHRFGDIVYIYDIRAPLPTYHFPFAPLFPSLATFSLPRLSLPEYGKKRKKGGPVASHRTVVVGRSKHPSLGSREVGLEAQDLNLNKRDEAGMIKYN